MDDGDKVGIITEEDNEQLICIKIELLLVLIYTSTHTFLF
jgi:hypothetical protein